MTVRAVVSEPSLMLRVLKRGGIVDVDRILGDAGDGPAVADVDPVVHPPMR